MDTNYYFNKNTTTLILLTIVMIDRNKSRDIFSQSQQLLNINERRYVKWLYYFEMSLNKLPLEWSFDFHGQVHVLEGVGYLGVGEEHHFAGIARHGEVCPVVLILWGEIAINQSRLFHHKDIDIK